MSSDRVDIDGGVTNCRIELISSGMQVVGRVAASSKAEIGGRKSFSRTPVIRSACVSELFTSQATTIQILPTQPFVATKAKSLSYWNSWQLMHGRASWKPRIIWTSMATRHRRGLAGGMYRRSFESRTPVDCGASETSHVDVYVFHQVEDRRERFPADHGLDPGLRLAGIEWTTPALHCASRKRPCVNSSRGHPSRGPGGRCASGLRCCHKCCHNGHKGRVARLYLDNILY